ncbi:MAG: tetratricopeptide repeat protein [Acidobacteria bacterium]|nr:tetratricopeptide repeat protein [Acidobacteriota bacterium]
MFAKKPKLAVRPTTEEIHFLMECGYLCQELGRGQAATDIFLGVSALCPDDPLPCSAIGTSLLAMGQVNEAAEHLQKVLAAFPDDPLTLAHLGEAYLCQKNTAEARRFFKQSLEKDSTGPGAEIARGYLELMRELE